MLLFVCPLLCLNLARASATDCGPANPPLQRLNHGSCEIAVKAAKCAELAVTDPVVAANLRDCARERSSAFTTDTILGCLNGLGEAATLPIKALVSGASLFYAQFAPDPALRAAAVETCFSSPDCREKVTSQSQQSRIRPESVQDFAKIWALAQRANAVETIELQRASLATQRNLIFQGLRPGRPGYDEALSRAPPGVADHLREVVDSTPLEGTPLLDLVSAKVHQLYAHTQCLDQKAVTELICYSALLIVVPIEAAAYLATAKVLAKLLPRARSSVTKAEAAAIEPVAVKPAAREVAPKPESPSTQPVTSAPGVIVHPPNTKPLGDLQPAELQRIQKQVDDANIDIYVVGSAAKGKRRNVDTNLPLANFGGPKAMTKSDIDYVVKNGVDDFANGLPLPDVDASFGVRGVDSINLKNSPAIHFRPHQPPVFVEGTGRLPLK